MPYKITTDPQRNGDLYNIWGNGQRLAKHVPNKTTARLFAAAPDLLEALEAAIGWYDVSDVRHLMGRCGETSHNNKILKQARAAIAKAKEES